MPARCRPPTAAAVTATLAIVLTAGCGSPTASPARVRAENAAQARERAEAAATSVAPTTTTSGLTEPTITLPTTRPWIATARLGEADLLAWGGRLRARIGAAGGVIALRYGSGEPVMVVTGGSDTSTDAPLRPDSPFTVGAVSESFTAAVALGLANEARLDLYAPIEQWLSWPEGDAITSAQLLRHRSGAGLFGTTEDAEPVYATMAADRGRTYTPEQVLAAAETLPRRAAPQVAVRQNPLSYFLLGYVIEAAAVRPFGVLLAERISGPLGLASTWYPLSGPKGPLPSPGTQPGRDGQPPIRVDDSSRAALDSLAGPAGAVVSTIPDLIEWADAVFRAKHVPGTDLSEMSVLPPSGLGHGVVGFTAAGACGPVACPEGSEVRWKGLSGDHPGSTVRVLYDPNKDVTLAVWFNGGATTIDSDLASLLDGLS